jgi:hypothetical protein
VLPGATISAAQRVTNLRAKAVKSLSPLLFCITRPFENWVNSNAPYYFQPKLTRLDRDRLQFNSFHFDQLI